VFRVPVIPPVSGADFRSFFVLSSPLHFCCMIDPSSLCSFFESPCGGWGGGRELTGSARFRTVSRRFGPNRVVLGGPTERSGGPRRSIYHVYQATIYYDVTCAHRHGRPPGSRGSVARARAHGGSRYGSASPGSDRSGRTGRCARHDRLRSDGIGGFASSQVTCDGSPHEGSPQTQRPLGLGVIRSSSNSTAVRDC
jgi:hypothetical protein